MKSIIFQDDLKKATKRVGALTILFLLVSVSMLLVGLIPINNISLTDGLIASSVMFIFVLFFGFYYLYGKIYLLTVMEDKIVLKTLFKKRIINIADIRSFKFERYYKSGYYQFRIHYSVADKNSNVVLTLTHMQEFVELLRGHNIEEIMP